MYRATLHNGTICDIFLGGRPWKEGESLAGRDAIPNHHWRQAHRNLMDNSAYMVRQRLAVYACEQWNKSHSADEQVAQMRLECFLDKTWPSPIPGEFRGALIWGTYPDGPSNAFDAMLQQSILGGENKGF